MKRDSIYKIRKKAYPFLRLSRSIFSKIECIWRVHIPFIISCWGRTDWIYRLSIRHWLYMPTTQATSFYTFAKLCVNRIIEEVVTIPTDEVVKRAVKETIETSLHIMGFIYYLSNYRGDCEYCSKSSTKEFLTQWGAYWYICLFHYDWHYWNYVFFIG